MERCCVSTKCGALGMYLGLHLLETKEEYLLVQKDNHNKHVCIELKGTSWVVEPGQLI